MSKYKKEHMFKIGLDFIVRLRYNKNKCLNEHVFVEEEIWLSELTHIINSQDFFLMINSILNSNITNEKIGVTIIEEKKSSVKGWGSLKKNEDKLNIYFNNKVYCITKHCPFKCRIFKSVKLNIFDIKMDKLEIQFSIYHR